MQHVQFTKTSLKKSCNRLTNILTNIGTHDILYIYYTYTQYISHTIYTQLINKVATLTYRFLWGVAKKHVTSI